MKSLLYLSTALSLALTLGTPIFAGTFSTPGVTKSGIVMDWSESNQLFSGQSSSRGSDDDDDDDSDRGRGRGGEDDDDDRDDDRNDDSSDDNSNDDSNDSGRSKPRVPGGSGCDDPQDILEHSECRTGTGAVAGGGNTAGNESGRRPRIPGGSGCDSLRDWLGHVDCRR